jgi:acyl-coenzyme A synthetase/AMP-(fatty) acid ligase
MVATYPNRHPQRDELIVFLACQFPRWMPPDDVMIVPQLPQTATGKLMKTRLPEIFHDHTLPDR